MDVQYTIKQYKQFKEIGIEKHQMSNIIVAESLHDEVDPQYVTGEVDDDPDDSIDDEKDFDISKIFIIHHENQTLAIFNVVDITCCLISSYVYAWIAFFGNDSPTNAPFFMTIIFEIIFSLSIILKFMTTFVEEGET